MAVGYLAGSPVVSVNGDDGPVVVLDASEVGADVTGAAAAALTAANAFTTAAVAAALASIAPGPWITNGPTPATDITLAAAWSVDTSGPPTYFPFAFRAGANGMLQGAGRLNTTTNYTAGVTIFTLPTALCPTRNIVVDVRIGGAGAAATFLTITSGGVASLSSSFTAGAGSWLQFEPINVRRT